MDHRTLLSPLCFGCEPLGGTDWGDVDLDAIAEAVDRALELGIDFFDTADVYGLGLSEKRLSAILGPRRHDVVIATKGGLRWHESPNGGRARVSRDGSPARIRRAVEASLGRLRLEVIPIYFIHWPDPDTDLRDTFECLMALRDEGKIGRIGCSNFDAGQVRKASEVADVSFVQLPVNLLGEDLSDEMESVVEQHDIGVIGYNVLANGLLTGKYDENSRFPATDRRSRLPLFRGEAFRKALRRVGEISDRASREGLTPAQLSIAEVVRRPYVVSAILGIKSRVQLEENARALAAVSALRAGREASTENIHEDIGEVHERK